MRSKRIGTIVRILIPAFLAACATVDSPPPGTVDAILDSWHHAAAIADEDEYFGRLAEDAVFLGTDATERWSRAEFMRDMLPYFQRESAWTYTPVERHVSISSSGAVAWFDELLMNDSYGECRGSGVLRLEDGEWKIVQYNLSIPIPNDIAKDVVGMIRAHEKGASAN